MQDLVELQAKLVRSQADIEKGLGHLVNQRAFIADKLVAGEDVTRPYELLEISKKPSVSMFSIATD